MMKMTAADVKQLGFAERVFAEPDEYTVQHMTGVAEAIDKAMYEFLLEKQQMDSNSLVEARYRRFRQW